MKNRFLLSFAMLLFLSAYTVAQVTSTITFIPQPVKAYSQDGEFTLKPDTRLYFPEGQADWELAVQNFMAVAQTATGYQLTAQPYKSAINQPRANAIYFIPDKGQENPEGYQMDITPSFITIGARTAAGAFYAVQSLRQMFPAAFNSSVPVEGVAWTVPCAKITDYPRFPYRGMHLDVGRHYFPVDFVKRYIDLLAQHKFNRFHWHLTEDQGWRIEIKKYPKLQSVAACRDETLVGHYSEQPHQFDGKKYCHYYTQDEVREIVEYAQKRFVTIVPEIEMPGHAQAALAAYPELGCTGGPYETAKIWGIFHDVYCAGNEETFRFLDDVLEEVCALFPGQYIHIGGDECPKDRWKACPKCQKRMKDEGLKDEHELQSYFIRRAEAMLAKRGKKLIGWDEILEGGLPATATVMSWRGTEGGIAAAKAGHDVIMTPGSHCYFDHYQSDPATEPLAIGGFTTLNRVYGYNPVPAELSQLEAQHILGAQGNVWTEYMETPEQVEYMAYPRACALAEVLWTPENKIAWNDFVRRLKVHFDRMDAMGLNYARSYYDVKSSFAGGYVVLSASDRSVQVKYTRDGQDPTPTSGGFYSPIPLTTTTTIKAVAVKDGKLMGNILTVRYYVHKASGKTYTMSSQPEQYSGGERYALTNGILGAPRAWNNWVGVKDGNIDPVIDLGAPTGFSKVTTHFLNNKASWVYPPRSIEVFVSDDGEQFRSVAKKTIDADGLTGVNVETVELPTPGAQGRYIKLVATAYGPIPESAAGAGNNAWLFLDEVLVD
ncbi:MAG: family 20 glycosylhydrolase [Lewinellaceae bacterium]|nr:family 20 glycosylhydrolase [Saprospiraceae bacterium]MCB9334344.1 family 20 glycosylhydrolase [Lewinellaceae bacterium]